MRTNHRKAFGGIALWLFALILPGSSAGQHGSHAPFETHHISEARVAILNVGVTSVLAVTRGVITGEVRSFRDAGIHALYGGGGGLALFQAKRLIGQGHEFGGMTLAYGSTSVLRNVGSGIHPLGVFCAGPGPADVCIRTGLDATADFGVRVEVNALSSISSLVMLATGHHAEFSAGTLRFRSPEPLGMDGGFVRTGYALGRTIVMGPDAGVETWRHELIHFVQSLQLASITPGYTAREMIDLLAGNVRTRPRLLNRRWDAQVDWVLLGFGAANSFIPYQRQWNEIEAYRLTTAPPEPPFVMFPRY
jgi:hypothetical protein